MVLQYSVGAAVMCDIPSLRASEDSSVQEGAGGTEVSGSESPPRRRGKRKLPVPDFSAIEDPAELRLQKRLVKNRRTAAASRCISQAHQL